MTTIFQIKSTSAVTETSFPVDTSQYDIGDCIGGAVELPLSVLDIGGVAILQSIMLVDEEAQKPTGSILIFSDALSENVVDQESISLDAIDIARLCGKVDIVTADWTEVVTSGVSVAMKSPIGQIVNSDDTSLFLVFVLTNSVTYSASTSLKVKVSLLRE